MLMSVLLTTKYRYEEWKALRPLPQVIAIGSKMARVSYPFYFIYVFLEVFAASTRGAGGYAKSKERSTADLL